jgi:hypothetical protein
MSRTRWDPALRRCARRDPALRRPSSPLRRRRPAPRGRDEAPRPEIPYSSATRDPLLASVAASAVGVASGHAWGAARRTRPDLSPVSTAPPPERAGIAESGAEEVAPGHAGVLHRAKERSRAKACELEGAPPRLRPARATSKSSFCRREGGRAGAAALGRLGGGAEDGEERETGEGGREE